MYSLLSFLVFFVVMHHELRSTQKSERCRCRLTAVVKFGLDRQTLPLLELLSEQKMAVCIRTSDNVTDLIEKVEYLSLGGVHAHSPHGVAQLPSADAAALVPSKIRYSKGIFELPLHRYR